MSRWCPPPRSPTRQAASWRSRSTTRRPRRPTASRPFAVFGASPSRTGMSRAGSHGRTWPSSSAARLTLARSRARCSKLASPGIPYAVAGMSNLFETFEAEAARQLFYFLADRPGVTDATLRVAWEQAATGVAPANLKRATAAAAAAKATLHEDDESRWSVFSLKRQFISFIEDAGLRGETVPNGRGEVVSYNLGKFSQIISDSRRSTTSPTRSGSTTASRGSFSTELTTPTRRASRTTPT